MVPECTPQRVNGRRDDVVDDRLAGPEALEDLGLRDDAIVIFDEKDEQIEDAALERDRLTAPAELTPSRVDLQLSDL